MSIDKSHQSLINLYKQSDEFLCCYNKELNSYQKEVLAAYAGLEYSNLAQKVAVLTEHDLYKKGFFRKLGQILL